MFDFISIKWIVICVYSFIFDLVCYLCGFRNFDRISCCTSIYFLLDPGFDSWLLSSICLQCLVSPLRELARHKSSRPLLFGKWSRSPSSCSVLWFFAEMVWNQDRNDNSTCALLFLEMLRYLKPVFEMYLWRRWHKRHRYNFVRRLL